MDPVRILKFASDFRIGGTERQFVVAATALDSRKFDVHVGCFRKFGPFLSGIERHGLAVSEYPIDSLYNLRSMRLRRRLATYLRRERIQVVHTYGFYANLFAVPAAWWGATPVVIASVRDSGDLWTEAQRLAQRAVSALAHHIVVNAEAVGDVLRREGYDPAKITVIRNGIDASRFTSARNDGHIHRELGLPPETPLVTVVSRLSRSKDFEFKGIHHFLDAAARVSAGFDDARFVIVGDGLARPEFERQAERLGLSRRVLFTGFRLDVPDVLAASTVAVLPSLSEGMSNSLLESMATGIPVVATRVGGNPEAIGDDECGILVPPRDDAFLASAIGRLLRDRELRLRLGRAGRERIAQMFSIRRMVGDTEALYRRLLEDRAGAPSLAVSRRTS
jgi:glycosyltransferase involved in cell wall biosynthesis